MNKQERERQEWAEAIIGGLVMVGLIVGTYFGLWLLGTIIGAA